MISKFLYVIIILLICSILLQVLQFYSHSKPTDGVEFFDENENSIHSIHTKLDTMLRKVDCLPDCPIKDRRRSNPPQPPLKLQPHGVSDTEHTILREDDDAITEEDNNEDNDNIGTDLVEGFVENLCHNCSFV